MPKVKSTKRKASNAPKKTNMPAENHDLVSDQELRRVRVLTMRRAKPACFSEEEAIVVNTTSTAKTEWSRGLSPFFVGPCTLADGHVSKNLENAWQFCKVYQQHADEAGKPTDAYLKWAETGWNSEKAHRFPMGRGARPLYSLWNGEKIDYITARKKIYCPLYAEAVQKQPAFKQLQELYQEAIDKKKPFVLLDHDGWDHIGQGFTLKQVLNFPSPKMGHAFVLAGLLEQNHFWL